ncbi:MAG TPA: RNA methyltransferase [Anaeromyxobacteraceae bacterium]|jgi:putative N6-adenine-specific DNA methylase
MARERLFAACAPGLEPLLAAELGALGLEARAVPGGAEAGGEDAVALACIGSRLADAVSLRLHAGPASGLAAAQAEARRRLGPGVELVARRGGGETTLSADAAGGPLYRRGWRARVGPAPLRETLAAAMLAFAGWRGEGPFLDPMCGSGTLAIEAALLAARRAPGRDRRFAFEDWPGHDPPRTAAVRARLAAAERPPPCAIHASDANGGAARLAKKNAEAAGVAAWVRIERGDAAALQPPPGKGLCAVNPPWGGRLGGDPAEAWKALAALLSRLAGWRLVAVAPDRGLESHLGIAPARSLETRSGGRACRLLAYDL